MKLISLLNWIYVKEIGDFFNSNSEWDCEWNNGGTKMQEMTNVTRKINWKEKGWVLIMMMAFWNKTFKILCV